MNEQLSLLPSYLLPHLQLALSALCVGVLLSVPLGVLANRVRWLGQPVLVVAGVIQTIPTLALLAAMVPLLAAAHLPSIGYLPAFIGLTLYSILPILRNTVTGLATVDPALIEAARGVGMTDRQRLLRVELPLAMPVIIAGIRTATIWTVGMATLSTPIGATSLGNFIFTGLQTRNQDAILVGCVAAAVLALALDGLVRLGSVGLERRRPALWMSALAALLGLYVYAGAAFAKDLLRETRERVVIGAKTFTEQYVLAEILAGQIAQRTDTPVEIAQSLGSTVAFDALRTGEVDVYVDYSGTIWATLMHRDGGASDRSAISKEVERFLREQHGIEVIGALGFENAYALAMPREVAARQGILRIGDLVGVAASWTIGGDYEFFGRAEWRAIRATYGLTFARERSMDSSLMYQAIAQRDVDVISAYSTDGRIDALDLVVLQDSKGAIPPYDALLLANGRFARRHPRVIEALRELTGQIDAGTMRQLNRAVDEHGESPRSAAQGFLRRAAH